MARDRKLYRIPVLGYLLHLIEAFFRLPRNDTRIDELRHRVKELSGQTRAPAEAGCGAGQSNTAWSDGLEKLVPEFLNAAGTVPALAHSIGRFEQHLNELQRQVVATGESMTQLAARIEQVQAQNVAQGEQSFKLWDRIEFVRREILYEMSHGSEFSRTQAETRTTRILDEEKVARFREQGALRLNLGCGHIALDGYINVDMRELPNVDVAAAVDALPFEEGTVDEVFSAHLIEHFPQEELRRKLLPYWYACLKPGGRFGAVTPDAAAMIAAAGAGTYGFEDFREVLFGTQDYEGDYHFNLLTPDSMTTLLQEAGFVDVEVPVAGRRNGKCFEFEIMATKPKN